MKFRLVEDKASLQQKYVSRGVEPEFFNRVYQEVPPNLKGKADFVLKNVIIHNQDIKTAVEVLKAASKRNLGDILDKTVPEVQQMLKPSKKELKKDVEIVRNDGKVLILVPKSAASAKAYGSGTKWCTTSEDIRQFEMLQQFGVLFYVISRTTNEKYGIYFTNAFEENWEYFCYDALDEKIPFDKIGEITGWTIKDFTRLAKEIWATMPHPEEE